MKDLSEEIKVLSSWTRDANLPIPTDRHQCVVVKDRLYMLGGWSNSGYLNTVFYTPILEDGSLGAWTEGVNLPIPNHLHQCVVIKDRLYMIGGQSSSGYLNTVYYAPILEDGGLGTWVKDTNLPISNAYHQCVVTKDRLYMIGGYNSVSGELNTVYYAPILEDGSLGTWIEDTNLPISSSAHQCLFIKNRLYTIGGNIVYYTPISIDGSLDTWVQDNNLPITIHSHQCVVTKNRLYVIGGTGGYTLNTVYYTPILEDSSLGNWTEDTNLPIDIIRHQCVVTKNRLYMIGGRDYSGSILNTVYYAPIL